MNKPRGTRISKLTDIHWKSMKEENMFLSYYVKDELVSFAPLQLNMTSMQIYYMY